MDSDSLKNTCDAESVHESDSEPKEVETQVQTIAFEDTVLELAVNKNEEDGSFDNKTCKSPEVIELNQVTETEGEGKDALPAGGVDDNPSHLEEVQTEAAPRSAEHNTIELSACEDADHSPQDDAVMSTSPAAPELTVPSDDCAAQSDDETSSAQQAVAGTGGQWVGGSRCRATRELSAQEKLQEAINKVEQLDRSLEKKLKENLVSFDWYRCRCVNILYIGCQTKCLTTV